MSEGGKWAMIHDVKATQNSSTTERQLGINQRVARWVRRCQETGGVAKVREPGRQASLWDVAGKHEVKLLLDGKHGGANHDGRLLQSKGLVPILPHMTIVL